MEMPPVVFQKLLTLCDHPVVEIKIAAITALGEGRATFPAVISKLLLLADDPRTDIKVAAAKALGRAHR